MDNTTMDMLTAITVVLLLQYIRVSNHYVVHLNLCKVICQLHLDKAGKHF